MNLLRHRVVGAIVVALTSLVPPIMVVSGGALTFATLRRGLLEGFVVLGLATALATMTFLGTQSPLAYGFGFFLLFIPCLLIAEVLRRTVSLRLAMLVATGVCVGGVVAVYAALPDPEAFWRGWLKPLLDLAAARDPSLDTSALSAALPYRVMTGMMAGSALITYVCSLLLGRWWQARAVNPGGFRQEFHELRLGRSAALLTGAIFIGIAVAQNVLMLNLAVVFLLLWLVQGLAVIHGAAGITGTPRLPLLVIYVVVIAGYLSNNPIVILVPLLGLVDQFLDVRTLLKNRINKGS